VTDFLKKIGNEKMFSKHMDYYIALLLYQRKQVENKQIQAALDAYYQKHHIRL
jgi:hypothetical protein